MIKSRVIITRIIIIINRISLSLSTGQQAEGKIKRSTPETGRLLNGRPTSISVIEVEFEFEEWMCCRVIAVVMYGAHHVRKKKTEN